MYDLPAKGGGDLGLEDIDGRSRVPESTSMDAVEKTALQSELLAQGNCPCGIIIESLGPLRVLNQQTNPSVHGPFGQTALLGDKAVGQTGHSLIGLGDRRREMSDVRDASAPRRVVARFRSTVVSRA